MPVIKFKALFKGRRKVKVRDLSFIRPTFSDSEGKHTKEVEVIKEQVPSPTRAIGCSIVNHNVHNCFKPDRSVDYTSLVILVSGQKVEDAEKYYFNIMNEGMHDNVVLGIRAPISHGALADFCQYMLYKGIQPIEINALLGIDCSQKDQSDAVYSSFLQLPFAFEYDYASYLATLPSFDPAIPITTVQEGAPTTTMLFDGHSSRGSMSERGFWGSSVDELFSFVDAYSPPAAIEDRTPPTSPVYISSQIAPLGSFSPSSASESDSDDDDDDVQVDIATTSPATISSAIEPKFSDFIFEKKLGQGAFGTVFRALHRPSGARVALKMISRALPTGKNGQSLSDEDKERYAAIQSESILHEFFGLYRSLGKSSILQLEAAFYNSNFFCLATTFHPGRDLETLLEERDSLPLDFAKFLAADIVIGLCVLRECGVIHRDLKPANLLRQSDGHLSIADLGLAHCCPTHLTDFEKSLAPPEGLAFMEANATEMATRVCGTPYYTAPEMVLQQPYSYPVDVWAFGVILFEMLIGGIPFSCSTKDGLSALGRAILSGDIGLSDDERTQLSPLAEDLILSALDANPNARPTPEQLKTHPFFDDIDWDAHTSRAAPPCWQPHPFSPPESSPLSLFDSSDLDDTKDDIYPYFSYLSPALQAISPAQPPADSGSVLDLGALVRSESTSTDLYPSSMEFLPATPAPQNLGSPVATSPSTTIVDGDSNTLSLSSLPTPVLPPSPTPRPLYRRALTHIKAFSRDIWCGLKARSWAT